MYPRTFNEFYERHPDIIRLIIIKSRWAEWDDVADLEQEVLSEMLRKNVVERFNPDLYDKGVTTALFMAYVKNCVTRMFLTTKLRQNHDKRSITNDAVSLAEPVSDQERTTLIGEPATAKMLLRSGGEDTKKTLSHHRAKSPRPAAPEPRPTSYQTVHRPRRFYCNQGSEQRKISYIRPNYSCFAER